MTAGPYRSRKRHIIAVLSALLIALLPTSVASAQQSDALTISPSTASAGQEITAYGCGFPSGLTTATLSAGGISVSPTNVSESSPTGCYNVTFTVPTLSAGTGSAAVGVNIGGTTDIGVLTITSSTTDIGTLTLTPGSASAGQEITAYGCGFPNGLTTATLSAGGSSVSPTEVSESSSTGCYNVTFTVSALTPGITAAAVGVNIGGTTDIGILMITSSTTGVGTLTLTPSTASAGQEVTTYGCGFSSGQSAATVTVEGIEASADSVVTIGTADCYDVAFTLPTLASGMNSAEVAVTIGTVTDSGILTITSNTMVGGTLTLTPSTASVGQQITAYGCGFPSGLTAATVTVAGSSTPAGFVVSSGTPDCYDVTFTLPAVITGATSAEVEVNIGGTTDSGIMTVTSSTTGLGTLTLTPSTASVGQQITAYGCGFTPGESTATVIVGDSSTQASSVVTAGTSDCYDVLFSLPTLTAGTSSATVSITIGEATDTGTLTVSAAGNTASLVPSQTSVQAGSSFTVSGTGFSTGSSVTITAFGNSQTISADGGDFSATITVPAGTAAGTNTVTAVSTAGDSTSATITVTAATPVLQSDSSSAQPGESISLTVSGFTPGEQVAISLAQISSTPAALDSTTQVYQADSTGSLDGVQYPIPDIDAGNYLILATGQTSNVSIAGAISVVPGPATPTETTQPLPTETPTSTPTIQPSPTPTVSQSPTPLPLPAISSVPDTTYFAEGYTGTSAVDGKVTFVQQLFLYNPTTVTSAVTTTYSVFDPATKSKTLVTKLNSVAAGHTTLRSVNADVGNDRMVSTTVSSSRGIVAEEVINRTRSDGTVLDGASSQGSHALARTWYLAEGSAGETLQEYLVLYNPGTTATKVQIRYLTEGTTVPTTAPIALPARSQVTINAGSQYDKLMPAGSRNIGAEVTADQPMAVDRVMYWGSGAGSAKYGSSWASAVATTSLSYAFPLLPTSSGSQPFVTVLNPSGKAANVALRLLDTSGNILITASAAVNADTRYTFDVASVLSGDHGNISAVLTSDVPVASEAPVYFGGSPNNPSTPGMVEQGSTGSQIGTTIDLPGSTGLLRICNPGTTAVQVQVTSGGSSGVTTVLAGTIAAGSSQEVPLSSPSSATGITVLATGDVSSVLSIGSAGSSITGGTLG